MFWFVFTTPTYCDYWQLWSCSSTGHIAGVDTWRTHGRDDTPVGGPHIPRSCNISCWNHKHARLAIGTGGILYFPGQDLSRRAISESVDVALCGVGGVGGFWVVVLMYGYTESQRLEVLNNKSLPLAESTDLWPRES